MYDVVLSNNAKKQLDKIDFLITKRIIQKLYELKSNPRPPGNKKLNNLLGYRIRIGDYRILYEIDDSDKIVTVYKISHRKEAYK